MENNYLVKNKRELDRLKNVLDKMNESLWNHKMGNWEVGSQLLHLAFWDKLTFIRLSEWKHSGNLAQIPDSITIDAINASFKSYFSLLDWKKCIFLILECAREIDDLVAGFNSEELKLLQDAGKERWYLRYIHRSEHLDKIEKSL